GRLRLELPQASRGTRSMARSLPGSNESENPDDLSLDELAVREREIVATALQRRNGKIYGPDGAAALLRVKPTTRVSMIKRLNVNRTGCRLPRLKSPAPGGCVGQPPCGPVHLL